MRLFLALAFASLAWCQAWQPNLVNTQLESRAYSGNLQAQIRADRPTWFGYGIKAVPKNGQSCCWNGQSQCGCFLEGNGRSGEVEIHSSGAPVQLEGTDALAVLFRVTNGTVEKIQAYSRSCSLDAGSLPFVWITGVPQDASLSFLRGLMRDGGSSHNDRGAVFAISQHEGRRATDILIEMARQDASSAVREQALFWLAQRAGERAAATITDAIRNDPDTEVKKKAVFALSQLPKDEAVSKLIEIAQTQRNAEVRKQAFFWLGQSHDPRALSYIEGVLTK